MDQDPALAAVTSLASVATALGVAIATVALILDQRARRRNLLDGVSVALEFEEHELNDSNRPEHAGEADTQLIERAVLRNESNHSVLDVFLRWDSPLHNSTVQHYRQSVAPGATFHIEHEWFIFKLEKQSGPSPIEHKFASGRSLATAWLRDANARDWLITSKSAPRRTANWKWWRPLWLPQAGLPRGLLPSGALRAQWTLRRSETGYRSEMGIGPHWIAVDIRFSRWRKWRSLAWLIVRRTRKRRLLLINRKRWRRLKTRAWDLVVKTRNPGMGWVYDPAIDDHIEVVTYRYVAPTPPPLGSDAWPGWREIQRQKVPAPIWFGG